MARVPDPAEVLKRDREAADRFAERAGQAPLRKALERAQRDLVLRLQQAEGLRGPGPNTFTSAQIAATLLQVRHVLEPLTSTIKNEVVGNGREATETATQGTIDYLRTADRAFTGVGTSRLPLDEAAMHEQAIAGSHASILRRIEGDPDHPGHTGVLQRYGGGVIDFFQRDLQQRLLARKPWDEVRSDLVASSPFLQQAPRFWAERILRTEAMAASGRASWESIRAADTTLGDMCKILVCGIDDRTGCLLGSTRVAAGVVRAVFRRWYEGPVLRLVTAAGSDFTATPNHPMLTRRGWVRADSLRPGDELIRDARKEHAGASGDEHVAGRPTTIGEVFDALAVFRKGERRRGRNEDFHGDGSDRDVEVLRPDHELRLGQFSAIRKPSAEHVFAPSDDVEFCADCQGLLSADAGVAARGRRARAERDAFLTQATRDARLNRPDVLSDLFERFAGLVSLRDLGVGQLAPAGMRVRGEAVSRGFGSGTGETTHLQRLEDVAAVGVHRCGNFGHGQAGRVQADRLLHIEVSLFRGHVFNLSTEDGYFVADGVYTGNSDSIAVHGQIRRPDESFDSWFGSFQHPPDRPNDRATVTPHRIAWEIPAYLQPRDWGEVTARWALEGHKKAMPGRPLMTTIDLALFGKPAGPPPGAAPAQLTADRSAVSQAPEASAFAPPVAPVQEAAPEQGEQAAPEGQQAQEEPAAAEETHAGERIAWEVHTGARGTPFDAPVSRTADPSWLEAHPWREARVSRSREAAEAYAATLRMRYPEQDVRVVGRVRLAAEAEREARRALDRAAQARGRAADEARGGAPQAPAARAPAQRLSVQSSTDGGATWTVHGSYTRQSSVAALLEHAQAANPAAIVRAVNAAGESVTVTAKPGKVPAAALRAPAETPLSVDSIQAAGSRVSYRGEDLADMDPVRRAKAKTQVEHELRTVFGGSLPSFDALKAAYQTIPGWETQIHRISVGHGEVKVRLRVFAPEHLADAIGEIEPATRTFSRDHRGLHVHHDYFVLPDAAQGHGVAEAMMRNAFPFYEKIGVHAASVSAHWVGRYTWAKFGFTWSEMRAERIKTDLSIFLRSVAGLEPSKADAIARVASRKSWDVAELDTGKTWVNSKGVKCTAGKYFLTEGYAGTSWDGEVVFKKGEPSYEQAQKRLRFAASKGKP